MATLSPQIHNMNLTGVLSESKRIILANYTHFVILAFLFLPISVYALITLAVDILQEYPLNHHKHLISYIVYILIVYTSALCATATITYSTHHAFFGEPVNLLAALKSLSYNFLPLVCTTIVSHVLLFLISLTFILFVGLILVLVQLLDLLVIDYNSIYFIIFSIVMLVTLFVILMYFQVKWSLASVVVVVESKWGYEPLKRSSYLVKGMRLVSLLVMLYFGICGVGLVWIYSSSYQVMMSDWIFLVVMTILGYFFLMIFWLRITAANTVLYNYCKALHGELIIENNEGFNHEYFNLPSYLEKAPVTFVATA